MSNIEENYKSTQNNDLNTFLNKNDNIMNENNQTIINSSTKELNDLTVDIKEIIRESKASKDSYQKLINSINEFNITIRNELDSFTNNTDLKEIYNKILNYKTDKVKNNEKTYDNMLKLKKDRTMMIGRIKARIINIDDIIKTFEKKSKHTLNSNSVRVFNNDIKKINKINNENRIFDSKSMKVISELNTIKKKYLKLFDYFNQFFKDFPDAYVIEKDINNILINLKKHFKNIIINYYI
jgi:hypothetical protein